MCVNMKINFPLFFECTLINQTEFFVFNTDVFTKKFKMKCIKQPLTFMKIVMIISVILNENELNCVGI